MFPVVQWDLQTGPCPAETGPGGEEGKTGGYIKEKPAFSKTQHGKSLPGRAEKQPLSPAAVRLLEMGVSNIYHFKKRFLRGEKSPGSNREFTINQRAKNVL